MRTLALLSCSAVVAAGVAAPAVAAGRVRVERITYQGWPGSLRISNGLVEAVVVPQIGRIMAFQFAGRPSTNPIFLNKAWKGKTGADADAVTWAAFGGDKLWPSPQGDWSKHAPRQWPPDQAFDGDPEFAQILPNGVRLVTPISSSFAARARRTITMKPGEPRLYISQVLQKDPDAAGERAGFPIGIWSITQVRGDGTIYMPLGKSPRSKTGWVSMSSEGVTETPPYFVTKDKTLIIRRDPAKAHKVSTDSAAGWMALLFGRNLLFSEHYKLTPGATYPGTEGPAEGYTNPADVVYMEMELLGPVLPLKAKEKTTYNVYWQLQRLPAAKANAAGVRAVMGK